MKSGNSSGNWEESRLFSKIVKAECSDKRWDSEHGRPGDRRGFCLQGAKQASGLNTGLPFHWHLHPDLRGGIGLHLWVLILKWVSFIYAFFFCSHGDGTQALKLAGQCSGAKLHPQPEKCLKGNPVPAVHWTISL